MNKYDSDVENGMEYLRKSKLIYHLRDQSTKLPTPRARYGSISVIAEFATFSKSGRSQ